MCACVYTCVPVYICVCVCTCIHCLCMDTQATCGGGKTTGERELLFIIYISVHTSTLQHKQLLLFTTMNEINYNANFQKDKILLSLSIFL